MKRLLMISVFVAGVLVAARTALALSIDLPQPTIFSFPEGFDQKKADAILRVLQSKRFHYLGGLYSSWSPDWFTTLVYAGDAKALHEFLSQLSHVSGIRVKVTFSRDLSKETGSALPTGSWWVRYSHVTPDTVTVRVNLAAQELGEGEFALWLAEGRVARP